MELTSLFFSICIYQLCRCGNEDDPSSYDYILDISPSNINDSNSVYANGIIYVYFSPERNEYFSTVVEGNKTIWIAQEEEKCMSASMESKGEMSLLKLKTLQREDSSSYCFEKRFNEWFPITNSEFKEKYRDMVAESIAEDSTEDTSISSISSPGISQYSDFSVLNIRRPDPSICTVYESPHRFIASRMLIPKEGNRITRVEDSGRLIWKENEDEKYVYCILYLKKNRPKMLLIARDTPSGLDPLFFKKKRFSWRMSKKKYLDKILGLAPKTIVGDKQCNLDIASEKETPMYRVRRSTIHGTEVVSYITRRELCITSVSDGAKAIWIGDFFLRCHSCDVYYRNGNPFLVVFDLYNMEESSLKCFEKQNGLWVHLEDEGFRTIVKEMEMRKMMSLSGYEQVS